jgi:proline iminopeptidase
VPKLTDELLPRRGLYPALEPHTRGRLGVSDLHEIYFEECGNPKGKPVVVLHGGPGGGISPFLRRFHDPAVYRIILFDQRGCGNSTPHACLVDNTTWHLVEDMEMLRKHLRVTAWQVFGGSWGSTLALAYAQRHPERVTELVVRGIFALREREVQWLYQDGASRLFPEAFESYLREIPADEHHDLLTAYHRRLTGTDEATRLSAARAWSQWEAACLSLVPDPQRLTSFGEDRFALAFANIECHYFINKGFLSHDGALLDGMKSIQSIPGVIVQGRYDVVTPPDTAYELAKRWPAAEFQVIKDAGHTALEPGITNALVRATENFSAS